MNFDKDLSDADFNEINELLMKLTPEELEQLNNEVDPDDQYLPAHQRCKDQTKKQATGKFDRLKLINFLEEQAKNEKDWDTKPYVKEQKGKVYQPPPPPPPSQQAQEEMDAISTEWDELLANASEAEIVELAALLGFTGLVNQVQFHSANSVNSESHASTIGGWNAAAKAEQLKFIPPEPDNQTNVDESIRRISSNDSGLTQLNLNNIKVC
jgi:tropomodulin